MNIGEQIVKNQLGIAIKPASAIPTPTLPSAATAQTPQNVAGSAALGVTSADMTYL